MRELTDEERIFMWRYTVLTGNIHFMKKGLYVSFYFFTFFFFGFHSYFIITNRFFFLFDQRSSELEAELEGEGDVISPFMSKRKAELEDCLKKIETKRAEIEPKWWSEWLSSNQNTDNKS
jgi:hypothetical protein